MKSIAFLGCVTVLICLCLEPTLGRKTKALSSAINPDHRAENHPHDLYVEKISNFIRGGHIADECEVEFVAGQECELPNPVGATGVYDACCSTSVSLGCKSQPDGSHKCVNVNVGRRSKSVSMRKKLKTMWLKMKKAAKLRRLTLGNKLASNSNKRNHQHEHRKEDRVPHNPNRQT
ncbi:uncharacterized protein [Ptychodera flava]|uniref:uncharacterized protein n=1 Tax=Ptychodera flava TaxID=63121 RepID=UPI00396A96D6